MFLVLFMCFGDKSVIQPQRRLVSSQGRTPSFDRIRPCWGHNLCSLTTILFYEHVFAWVSQFVRMTSAGWSQVHGRSNRSGLFGDEYCTKRPEFVSPTPEESACFVSGQFYATPMTIVSRTVDETTS